MLAAADDAAPPLAEAAPAAPPPPPDALARWLALPPLADAVHAQALELRFSGWQQARQQALTQARQERRSQQRALAKEHQRAEPLLKGRREHQRIEDGDAERDTRPEIALHQVFPMRPCGRNQSTAMKRT